MIKDVIRISKELLYDMPFYGAVMLSLNKRESRKIQTACVGLQGVSYELLVNPDFWDSIKEDKKKQGLIVHELGHIINFHLTEYSHLKNKKVANVAMDLYINQKIPADMLPDGGCTVKKFDLPEGKDTNWYYNKLMEQKEQDQNEALQNMMQAIANGDSEFNDGDGNTMKVPEHKWDEIEKAPEAIKKLLEKNTETLIREIIKNSDPGSVPAGLEEMLDDMFQIEPEKFNWRAFMRTFVGTSTKTWIRKTRRKKSNRFKGMPGQREQYFSHILVAIDTSLSVCEEELAEFRNELHHMHKTGHDIDIMMCDTEIQSHFRFNPRKEFVIKGRGGTRFKPVVDFYEKNLKRYSCLIYLTDGEAYDVETARGNILWVHSSKSREINEDLPGRKIQLN